MNLLKTKGMKSESVTLFDTFLSTYEYVNVHLTRAKSRFPPTFEKMLLKKDFSVLQAFRNQLKRWKSEESQTLKNYGKPKT